MDAMDKKVQKVIAGYKSIALSDQDVLRIVEGKARVLIYRDLAKFSTLDEALGEHGAIFLLYESRPDFGHWTLVMRRTPEEVEFFDSYGIFPDEELNWVGAEENKQLGQSYPYLSKLLHDSPYPKLEYNDHKFQKMSDDVSSCGRWAALRLILRDLTINEFKRLFKGKNGDDLVTLITELISPIESGR